MAESSVPGAVSQKEPNLLEFVILHVWRHPRVVAGCEGCAFLSRKDRRR